MFVLQNTAVCLYYKIQLCFRITKYSCVFVLQNAAVCLYYKIYTCVFELQNTAMCLYYKIQQCVCITKYTCVFVFQNRPHVEHGGCYGEQGDSITQLLHLIATMGGIFCNNLLIYVAGNLLVILCKHFKTK